VRQAAPAAAIGCRAAVGRRALWAPIALLELYLASTVFIFFFGPVDWHVPNVPKLLAFLAVNYGGLWLGYRWGIGRRIHLPITRKGAGFSGDRDLPPIVKRLLLVSMIFAICSMLTRLVAVRGGVGAVWETLLNPGEAYMQAQLIAQLDRDGMTTSIEGYSWAFRVSTLLAVFNTLYFPVAVSCWKRLGRGLRSLFFVALACSIVFAVGTGAQSGIGFMIFSVLPVALHRLCFGGRVRNGSTISTQRTSAKRKTGRTAFLIGVSFILLVGTVVFFQLDRAESSGQEMNSGDTLLVGVFGTPAARAVPFVSDERISFGVSMLLKYASHGYEGLALAMELPFDWTYGLGWSRGLQVFLRDYLRGPELFDKLYVARNEAVNGWPALAWWSTIFPWIASDTTFFGTVLFTLLVGLAIGRLWTRVIATENPFAFALLGQLFVLVFMFPANNALAQTLDGLFSLLGTIVIYIASRRFFWQRRR
jgi:hypothetical protein